MKPNQYKEIFNREFLIVLSEWQKGWGECQEKRRKLADRLVEVCTDLPSEFKSCDSECFRKRFILGGEIVPIILNDDFFEGIASWTLDESFAKDFKQLVRPSTSFAMVFKHTPNIKEVIVNLCSLWDNDFFKTAVSELNNEEPDIAYPLLNFKDFQSEVVLRTTLKGSEIEYIVGVSSDFDEICNLGQIPEDEREELSIKYAQDPNGIPIYFPTYASSEGTRGAVRNTIVKMRELIADATSNNVPIYNLVYDPNPEDLKHKILLNGQ
jgi:hypothetical protein